MFLGVAAFVVVVGVFTQEDTLENFNLGSIRPSFSKSTATSTPQSKIVKIKKTQVTVEVADNSESRKKGLSGVKKLEKNNGILFVFEKENSRPPFWMKDMLIAIDIIWIDDGEIVQIDSSVQPPAPNTPDNQLKLFSPNQPIDQVLEVNAGYSDANNFQVGDSVDLSQAL